MNYNKFLNNTIPIGSRNRYEFIIPNLHTGTGGFLDIGSAVVPSIREKIIELGYNYTGIDLREGEGIIVMDASKLALENENFDAVLISTVLEYIEDWQNAIKEATRVLKHNGVMYIYSPISLIEGKSVFIPENIRGQIIKLNDGSEIGTIWKFSVEDIIFECSCNSLCLHKLYTRYDCMDMFATFRKD